MEVILAKSAGFCFGVDRAVNLVYDLVDRHEDCVCTLGPIIHNPQIVAGLSARGVRIIGDPEEAAEGSTVVIRSHGVEQGVYDRIRKRGLRFVDATCPFVSKIHKIAKEQSEKGATVLIAGNAEHPEVKGIRSFCAGESYTFGSLEELKRLTDSLPELAQKQIAVVSQTTFRVDEWNLCSDFIKKVYTNVLIFDTICVATSIRQQEAIRIAKEADLMIIIGGRESSNTAKLLAVCSRYCPSVLIEGADELPFERLKGKSKVGVTAGASTPARIIKEVLNKMSDYRDSDNNEEIDFAEAVEQSFKTISSGERVRGVVIGVSPTEIQIDLGTKHAGYIPQSEFSDDSSEKLEDLVKAGDELDLIVLRVNDVDGTVMLSKKRVDAVKNWDDIVTASEDETVLSGKVTDVVKGGVLAVYKGIRVFIPASQSGVMRNDSLEKLLHEQVKFRIIEINTQRKRAVGSIRSVLRDERKQAAEKFWEEVEIGKEYTGTVKSMTSYGAFVDLGGVDGMIHVSELSWQRVKNPSEVVSIGETVKVTVKDLNRETKKISLTYKKLEDNPWVKFLAQYKVGDIITVEVINFMPFGAFAQIIPGVDGLIHISQISQNHIAKPQDALKIGQKVNVKITNIEEDKKRISLSIKVLEEEGIAVEPSDSAPAEPAETTESDVQ